MNTFSLYQECQNMKIADILFFIANLITVYSSNVQQISSSESTMLLNEGNLKKKLDKDCPQLSKIIRDNNVTDYTIDCKTLNMKTHIVNEENVLQQACFVVKNMLYYLCDSKHNVTADLFKLNNVSSVCPFDFSHIKFLENLKLSNSELVVKELTHKVHCPKVCDDLYNTKRQCAVLSQLNSYLNNQILAQQNTVPLEIDKSKVEHNKLLIQKSENSYVNKNERTEQQLAKSKPEDIMIKVNNEKETMQKSKNDKETILSGTTRTVTNLMEEQKIENINSTSKDEQRSKTDVKMQDDENFMDDDFKSTLEDQNEDGDDEDGVHPVPDSLPDKSDIGKIDKISVSPPRGKEIYPAEGFFQAEDSHFFFYFIMASSIIVVGYLAFHNKNKILAYALEGTSARRSRRRPNPARYRKLETNLEEAITSGDTNLAGSNIVY